MRIGIDCRMYGVQAGIGRYIRNLIFHLQKIDKQNEYFLFLRKKDYDNKFNQNFKKVLADYSWYGVSEQIKLPRLLGRYNLDIVHFPHFNVPVLYLGRFVVTIHDLTHQYFQMRRVTIHNPLTYKIKQLGYKTVFKNAIKRSKKVLVPSNYVKNLLISKWNMESGKTVITAEAVDDKIFSIEDKMKKADILKVMEKFNIKVPYIFYVGNAHPHKNVEGLIRTFISLRKNYQYLTLVLSGGDHYFWQRIKKEYQQTDIIYTGLVSDEQLVALYKNAACFVMPSFEEGFGIPILEAMVCKCPVVSSNRGALPEIGADAAFYFDPYNEGDMKDKVDILLQDSNFKSELIKKGQKRVKIFSWEKLARQTLGVYLQCV